MILLAILAAVLLAPIWAVARAGFVDQQGRPTLSAMRWVLFEDDRYYQPLWNSVQLAFWTTLLCLLISIPLALIAENFRFRGRRGWLALIQIPMVLPPFVGAIGMKALLARHGGLNALLAHLGLLAPDQPIEWLRYPFWSCVVLEALYLYPITFLNVQAALANIDPALEEAARNLGAGPWRRFWQITLPLMRPGVFAGSTIVFIWAFTELGTPLMVGYRALTAVQVFDELQTFNPTPEAYALVVVLLVVSTLLYLLGRLVLGRPTAGALAKATIAAQPTRLGGAGTIAATLPFAFVFVLACLPLIGVLLVSISRTGMLELHPRQLTLQFHAQLLRDVFAIGQPGRGLSALSVVNSFKYSVLATAIDLVLGFAIAYLVVRRRSALTATLDALAMLPLAVPGLVMAMGYFVLTQGKSPLAALDPLRADPTPLLVTAYAVRRLPFLVRSCAAGLEQTSVSLEEAAVNLGAGRLRTVVAVTLPLLAANFIAGGLLVFSRSMLEVSDSLILAFDRDKYPMTKAIYDLADNPNFGLQIASALGVWGMILLAITIIGASAALGKRLGALFRV